MPADTDTIEPVATAVAVTAANSVDVAKISLTDVALARFGDWRKPLDQTKTNLSTLVLDLSTASKITEARSLRQRLIGDPLAEARKVSRGIKSALADTSKAVGAELDLIETGYTEADALILPKIEAREAEIEREKQEKAAKEEARKAAHLEAIATLRGFVELAQDRTPEQIAKGIDHLNAMVFGDAWEEFGDQARAARDQTVIALKALRDEKLAPKAADGSITAAQISAGPLTVGADFGHDAGTATVEVDESGTIVSTSTEGAPEAAASNVENTARVIVGGCAAKPTATEPSSAQRGDPTLSLGAICERLHFTVTSDFLAELGFAFTKVKAAKLYHDDDWAAICAAIVDHVQKVAGAQAVVA